MPEKIVWALLDDRQGNTNQTLGVADALGIPYQTKRIEFNAWTRLPNLFLYHSALAIRNPDVLQPPWPDVVISTARRLGLVASYIKHRHPAAFLAQIQWPGRPADQFDLIAAPLHDDAPKNANVFETLGAPHRVAPETLSREAELWRAKLAHLPSPRIALLVGGSSRNRHFEAEHARALGEAASRLAQDLGGSLLVTTSRRTGEEATRVLREHLYGAHYFHGWNDADSANPYFGFLGLADAVIATGESVSMCSEACATGKPVYIYASDDFMSPKHRVFVAALFAKGHARPLAQSGNRLFVPSRPLDEAATIAAEIRRRAHIG